MSSFAEGASQDQGKPTEGQSFNEQPKSEDQTFEVLIGERKYSSLDDVKTKVENQDKHIQSIEDENSSLREEIANYKAKLAEAAAAEDVLDGMRNKDNSDKSNQLDLDKVKELTRSELQEYERAKARNANHAQCEQLVAEVYGQDGIAKLASIAQELSMSMEDVDEIAYRNPKQFERLFIQKKEASAPANSTPSSVRSSTFQETPEVDDVKSPLSLMKTKDRTSNYLKALEKHLSKQS